MEYTNLKMQKYENSISQSLSSRSDYREHSESNNMTEFHRFNVINIVFGFNNFISDSKDALLLQIRNIVEIPKT